MLAANVAWYPTASPVPFVAAKTIIKVSPRYPGCFSFILWYAGLIPEDVHRTRLESHLFIPKQKSKMTALWFLTMAAVRVRQLYLVYLGWRKIPARFFDGSCSLLPFLSPGLVCVSRVSLSNGAAEICHARLVQTPLIGCSNSPGRQSLSVGSPLWRRSAPSPASLLSCTRKRVILTYPSHRL